MSTVGPSKIVKARYRSSRMLKGKGDLEKGKVRNMLEGKGMVQDKDGDSEGVNVSHSKRPTFHSLE
jgi:hypothetical protein